MRVAPTNALIRLPMTLSNGLPWITQNTLKQTMACMIRLCISIDAPNAVWSLG